MVLTIRELVTSVLTASSLLVCVSSLHFSSVCPQSLRGASFGPQHRDRGAAPSCGTALIQTKETGLSNIALCRVTTALKSINTGGILSSVWQMGAVVGLVQVPPPPQ